MSRTKLANFPLGEKGKDHIARWIAENAQAFCHLCERYLTYFDRELADNYYLAMVELRMHYEEHHGNQDSKETSRTES